MNWQNYYNEKINSSLIFLFTAQYSAGQTANCWPDISDNYWKIDEALYGSKRLSNCDPNAYYNCHGFVMSYFENGCIAPGWDKPQVPAPCTCPNTSGIKDDLIYKNSGLYVQVCSESSANIAYYDFGGGEDHSAVKEITGNGFGPIKYLSKYAENGPLVAHNLMGSWYHLAQSKSGSIQFWSYIGKILGITNITGLNQRTFVVNNIPNITYLWSIQSGYENIVIASGGSTNSVTLTPQHSGTAVLQLSISSSCGTVKTQQIALSIQTNVCLEGVFTQAGITKNLNTTNSVATGGVNVTLTCPNATYFNWQKTSGNVNDWIRNGNQVNFTMLSGGSISFNVTAYGSAGQLGQRTITFYNYGSFLVYPNPASSSISVDLNKELNYTLVLQGMDGLDTKEAKGICGNQPMDVSQLKNGDYSLLIYNEGKLINQQRVVIKK